MLKNLTTQLKCKNAFEGKTMNFQNRYKLVNLNSPISAEFTIKIIPSKKTLGQSGLSGEVHIFLHQGKTNTNSTLFSEHRGEERENTF
jgi:hypothetical protein